MTVFLTIVGTLAALTSIGGMFLLYQNLRYLTSIESIMSANVQIMQAMSGQEDGEGGTIGFSIE